MILLVLLYFDKQKVYKGEKPPIPSVTIGEQEMHAILGSYKWNDKKVEKELKDILMSVDYKKVDRQGEFKIQFPDAEKPIYIARGIYLNGKFITDTISSIFGENKNFLVHNSSYQNFAIKAYWENGKSAEYLIPINVRKPDKSYHANLIGGHSLLIANNEQDRLLFEIQKDIEDSAPTFILDYHSINLDTARKYYPELKIEHEPYYILFHVDQEVFRSNKLDELKQYIDAHSNVIKKNIEGYVNKIDRKFNVLEVDGVPLVIDDVLNIRVGQKISLEVTYLNKDISYYHVVEQFDILEKPNEIFSDKNWLSKEIDKLSILAIGNTKFTKPFTSSQNVDLRIVSSTTVHRTLKLKNGQERSEPAIYVFNNRELVYQTDHYDELLKYLFETEQLKLLMP